MFTLEWFDNELAGLIVQLHQIEGAISTLQQMRKQVEDAEREPEITMQDLQDMLPEGVFLEGIEEVED